LKGEEILFEIYTEAEKEKFPYDECSPERTRKT